MRVMIHNDKAETIVAPLRRRHPDAEISICTDYPSLPHLLEEHRPEALYTVRFAGTPGFPRPAILAAPSLRWVSVGGSGTDHLAPWDPARLTVTNAAGVGAPTMAQYAIAAALHFTLGLSGFATAQRPRRWAPTAVASLEGRTILILGLGKTGQAVARLAKAHGMQVIGLRARPAPMPHANVTVMPRMVQSGYVKKTAQRGNRAQCEPDDEAKKIKIRPVHAVCSFKTCSSRSASPGVSRISASRMKHFLESS